MPDATPETDLSVVDVVDVSRFELLLDGQRVGLADYSLTGNVITVPHVETDPAHQGQGFAAVLMKGVLDSARSNGQTIAPLCPYAAAYMRRRPETQDLLADSGLL
ncbi:MAG: GNAT family N-acetyltransferase [Ilumatobacter sp.]